jgi:TonB family protein
MNNLFLYLIKVSAGTTLLYLCYLIFFRKDTFYLRNRIYLLLTLLLPTTFPLIKLPVYTQNPNPMEPGIYSTLFPVNSYGTTVTEIITPYDYDKLFIWIYFTITGLLFLRALISLISTYTIIKKGTIKSNKFPKIIISDDDSLPPFSFFPYAVIPVGYYEKGDYTDILDHEFAHIRQVHTFDLLLSELFIVFEWFNPFVWLIRRSVLLNHEYLADHTSIVNKSVLEYQYRLLNFQPLKNISLAHNFSCSIKNRIIMLNKKQTNKSAALKNMLVLPVVAFAVYAFAIPEYRNLTTDSNPLLIYQAPDIIQKTIRGTVVNEEGQPLEGVTISKTGTSGNVLTVFTDKDGGFTLSSIPPDSYLIITFRGYKRQTIKINFESDVTTLVIKMIKDPEYKEPGKPSGDTASAPRPLVLLDGTVTEEMPPVLIDKLGSEFGTIIVLKEKEATDKYGEAGKNGAYEVYTRKKAIELGLKFPFRRYSEDDYPRFMGENHTKFSNWVLSQLRYPSEATSKGIQGRVSVNYIINADGSVSDVKISGKADPLIADEVIKVVQSSPKWDPAINPEARVPFASMLSLKFELPDKVMLDDVFVMVEKMPLYPGGDTELLKYISNNTKYPEAAKAEKIEGRVIIRFIVNTRGKAEDVQVLRGVHPLLDDEAVRVVSGLSGFEPGMQGGKAVNVWYMVPITFVLPKPETP